MNQKRVGIILSYVNLILGMVINLYITPLLITTLGDVDYSIYKVMQSFAGPLTMFHLGISAIVTRSIVRYKATEDYTEEQKQNTLAHSLLASGVMSLFVVAAGAVMWCLIPTIYGGNYDADSISLGQTIFIIFVLASVFHMMTDAFSGCVIGHEKFAVSAATQLGRNLLRLLLLAVLMMCNMGVVAVVSVDLILSISVFVFTLAYSFGKLHERPKFIYFDKQQIKEILLFGSAILLQALVNQVNNNVDTIILGAMINEKAIITMYSSALAIYAIYNSLVSVITNFFLPKATKLIVNNASGVELTDFVIGPGRFQAIIAVGCVCGFALFGMNFITIWIGKKYIDAYWVTLMLMIPVTIPLVENAAISILDASLKRMFRSVVLVIMAVLNVGASIVLVSFFGFWGAAWGTVLSLIIGHGFLMNIYYAKTYKMEIGRMLFSIFKGILPAGLAASALCLPLVFFLSNTTLLFLVKCLSFVIIYFVFLWLFGMNSSEKDIFRNSFSKVMRRKKQ